MVDPRRQLLRSTVTAALSYALELVGVSRRILQRYSCRERGAGKKPDGTLVSIVDREIETAFRQMLKARFPDHGVIGEEFSPIQEEAEFLWYLDPIDGTEDYLRGMPYYGTIIGLTFRGHAIVGVIDLPGLDLCCHAATGFGTHLNGEPVSTTHATGAIGQRILVAMPALEDFTGGQEGRRRFLDLCERFPNFRTFRTCYSHVLAATGGVDAAVEYSVSPWDISASRILIEESGGRFVQFRRDQAQQKVGVVLGRAQVVSDIANFMSRQ